MTPEHYTITSSSGEYTRQVWFLPSPTIKPHALCLFLDAEHYLRDMNSLPIIVELMESGAIPPMTCLFVSHVSGEARHHDYTCNDRYTKFIAEDVVKWARAKDPNLQNEDNVICGLSLSGLAGAYIVLHYPSVFSYALCQSGSFWWLKGKDLSLPPTKAKFWMSVGDKETAVGETHPPTGLYQEISQIDGVKNATETFESLGGTVKFNLYSGSHAAGPFREDWTPALKWLIGK